MSGDVHEFLSIALKAEECANRRGLGERLTDCLKEWQGLDVCSFATAFEIEGNALRLGSDRKPLIYNGLHTPNLADNPWRHFLALTEPPSTGMGSWPWDMLRAREAYNTEGMFPAELLQVTENLPNPLWAETNSMQGEIRKEFSARDAKTEALSWKWYAVYPALLGDAIRNDEKKTQYLVYILGTRREFLRADGGRNRDFGLIVGLTISDQAGADRAREAILAAWNILVVAEHIVDDAERIGNLEAARSMSHTFRTYVEAVAVPSIRPIVRREDRSGLEDAVIGQVSKIGLLAAFMGFVARGGIARTALRGFDIEPEEYDIADFICSRFKNAAADEGASTQIKLRGCNGVVPEVKRRYVRKLYLSAICAELIKNVRDHGKPNEAGSVPLTVSISPTNGDGNDRIELVLTNPPKGQSQGQIQKKNADPVRGLRALKGMLESIGGTMEYPALEDCKDEWKTSITLDLNKWKQACASVDTSVDKQETAPLPPESRNPEGKPFDNESASSPPEPVALRVLILDDELAETRNAERSCRTIGNIGDWQWYRRTFKGHPFVCFFYKPWRLELVLCRSVFLCRDHLLDEHFDLCLVDIDFRLDSERGSYRVPSLGGLLPAISLVRDDTTLVTIFTAKGPELRDDPNYDYLYRLSEKRRLGPLQIHEQDASDYARSKEIAARLKEALRDWAVEVLPRLSPGPPDCSRLATHLVDGGKNAPNDLRFGNVQRPSVPFKVFTDILENDSRKPEVIKTLLKTSCGHGLVNYLFRKIAHDATVQKALNNSLENSHQSKFEQAWVDACKVFRISDCSAFRKMLLDAENSGNGGAKKYYRIDLKLALSVTANGNNKEAVLYGLFENPATWVRRLKNGLKQRLMERDGQQTAGFVAWCQKLKASIGIGTAEPVYSLGVERLGPDGTVTDGTPYGHRITIGCSRPNNEHYQSAVDGAADVGDIGEIKECLEPIAASLALLGPRGPLNLKGVSPTTENTENVVLEIITYQYASSE